MARCMRCNAEIRPRFAYCFPCSKLPKTPMTHTVPEPDRRKRTSYRDKAPRDWHYQEYAGPVIIHQQEPEPPTAEIAAKQRWMQRKLTLRSWKRRNGRSMSGELPKGIDNNAEKD